MCKDAATKLEEIRQRFPAFRIGWEFTHGRRPRYIARRTRDGVHPHTLVTADLAELHDELSRATTHPHSRPGRALSVASAQTCGLLGH